jgi:hypothetical protein
MNLVYLEADGRTLRYNNGVLLGSIDMGVDGYYMYWPIRRNGYWNEQVLRAIADLLGLLNDYWDKQVIAGLEECSRNQEEELHP